MDPKHVVRQGYERAASEYDAWSARVDAGPRSYYLSVLSDLVEPAARVLDLGCGTGLVARELAKRFEVVGVDFSAACLQLARETPPRRATCRPTSRASGFDPRPLTPSSLSTQ